MNKKSKIKIKVGVWVLIVIISVTLNTYSSKNQMSKLKHITLPNSTNNININIDNIQYSDTFNISGWAYINEKDTSGSKKYVVLKNDKNDYVFTTKNIDRPDVSAALNNNNLNSSGFSAQIKLSNIEYGEYILGMYIENKDKSNSYKSIGKKIVYDEDGVSDTNGIITDISLPQATNDLAMAVDICKIENNFLLITGWAHIQFEDSNNLKKYIVLQSEDKKQYVFNTNDVDRPDVTKAFADTKLDLNNSGISCKIDLKNIKSSQYQIGYYVVKDGVGKLAFTNKTISV